MIQVVYPPISFKQQQEQQQQQQQQQQQELTKSRVIWQFGIQNEEGKAEKWYHWKNQVLVYYKITDIDTIFRLRHSHVMILLQEDNLNINGNYKAC